MIYHASCNNVYRFPIIWRSDCLTHVFRDHTCCIKLIRSDRDVAKECGLRYLHIYIFTNKRPYETRLLHYWSCRSKHLTSVVYNNEFVLILSCRKVFLVCWSGKLEQMQSSLKKFSHTFMSNSTNFLDLSLDHKNCDFYLYILLYTYNNKKTWQQIFKLSVKCIFSPLSLSSKTIFYVSCLLLLYRKRRLVAGLLFRLLFDRFLLNFCTNLLR